LIIFQNISENQSVHIVKGISIFNSNEKNVSTIGKKEKKQARIPWKNVNCKWSPCIGSSPCKRKTQIDSFRREER